jgi:hypothetical protein
MIRLTLEDNNGTYSVELKTHGDTIQPVFDAFVGVLGAAGYSSETINAYIATTDED